MEYLNPEYRKNKLPFLKGMKARSLSASSPDTFTLTSGDRLDLTK